MCFVDRFGRGYMLTIKCEPSREAEFVELMKDRLNHAKLEDSHCSQLKFSISQDKAHLSQIFQVMDSAKWNELIEDYSVSQTTLDDVGLIGYAHPMQSCELIAN